MRLSETFWKRIRGGGGVGGARRWCGAGVEAFAGELSAQGDDDVDGGLG